MYLLSLENNQVNPSFKERATQIILIISIGSIIIRGESILVIVIIKMVIGG